MVNKEDRVEKQVVEKYGGLFTSRTGHNIDYWTFRSRAPDKNGRVELLKGPKSNRLVLKRASML